MKQLNDKFIIIFLALLSLSLLSTSSFAAITIKIKGLEHNKKLQEYIETLVIGQYTELDKINTYALKQDTLKAVKAKGYYDAKVSINQHHDRYILLIDPASVYHISNIKVTGYDYEQPLKIAVGSILDADEVLSEQKNILNSIKSHHCFYTLTVENQIHLDRSKHIGELIYLVTTGPNAQFGKTTFSDLKTVNSNYIRSLVTYKENTCWNLDQIEETKTAMMNTGLFSYIKTELPPSPSTKGIVDVHYDFEERPPRSVRLGVNYTSDEGPGFFSTWGHRNILGSAEEITFDLKTSAIIQSLKTDFFKPQLFGPKQSLSIGSLLEHKNTDAYQEDNFNLNSKYIYQHSKSLSASLGTTMGISEIKDKTEDNRKKDKQTFGLLSFPANLVFDNRDNKLDSHHGMFNQSTIEPFGDLLGSAAPFLRLNQTNTFYFDLSKHLHLDPVLAFRNNIGSILGNSTADIPASKRYFAGGGNSVRGIEFQHAGPVENNDPTGGRSLIELSSELRFNVTKNIGLVTFVDAGNVYHSTIPDLKNGMFIGTGAGLRYFTGFGPIRLDLAVPVNKLKQQREHFGFYISIGQAY